MRLLIQSVQILDPSSPFHGQRKDVWIEHGYIREIADTISREADTVLEAEGMHLSVGWLDMRVSAKDPGHEHKEDLQSVSRAAAAGGFTEIAVLPHTYPVVQTKEGITYQKRQGENGPVRIHPMGAVTLNNEGKELTEMIDLSRAGAVAFSDGDKPVWHTDIFVKTLQYLQPLRGLLINRPEDTLLTRFGTMNEGISSTLLGLKGMPALAEEMMVSRDLQLLAYVTQPGATAVPVLHFSLLSSVRSVALVREAKRQGWPVSCDMAAHQIAFDDTALADFDTYLKVNPPFRSQQDIAALWEGLADGTIDAIVSDHNPQDEESKKLEFDLAEFGIIGLETAFAVVHTHDQRLSLDQLIEKFTVQPRRILRLPQPTIAVGQMANLTLFDTRTEWTFTEADIQSKSRNTPFVGKRLKGQAVTTILGHVVTSRMHQAST